MRVDFMIIGAQKSGTTSLAAQLGAHPAVAFCRTKEPGFFNDPRDWRERLGEYHSLFRPTAGQICGEASTMYTFLPEWAGTPDRIHAYNPEVKLIYVMRDPIERIASQYAFRLLRGRASEPIDTEVVRDPAYLNRSRYWYQLKPYLEHFPRVQLLPLVFEDYVADAAPVLRRVADFLGIAGEPFAGQRAAAKGSSVGSAVLPDSLQTIWRSPAANLARQLAPGGLRRWVRDRVARRLPQKPMLSPATRRELWRLLEPEVTEVEALMGRRLDIWRAIHNQVGS